MKTSDAFKECNRCHAVKSVTEFTKRSTAKDGLNQKCRECTRSATRRYHAENKDKESARKAKAYLENKDAFLARNRAWRSKNIERSRATNKSYYWRNRDKVRQWHADYHEKNPHVARQCSAKRRVRLGEFVTISPEMIQQRMEYFGCKCWMCGGDFEHVDHVKPLAKGGPHILSNLRPACRSCNSAKKDKWPLSNLSLV